MPGAVRVQSVSDCPCTCRCQVFHDSSGIGKAQLSPFTAFFLGHWHIYKMASIALWRLAGAELTGPLFHNMFPSMQWFPSPSLSIVARMLSLLRLAYPQVRDDLLKLHSQHIANETRKQHISNLVYFFEWLLPKVSSVAMTCIFRTYH